MNDTALLTCAGTVTVHRDHSVTCSDDACPRDLNRGRWFSMHTRFVQCAEVRDTTHRCPECAFEAHVAVRTAP